MIFKVSNLRKTFLYFVQGPKFYGAGTPSTPTETTQTLNQNSIPSQLLPYTQTMMGAAENQIYTKDASGAVTGFQPYKPYSTNASDYVAPFSPLQQQAQQGAADLQTPSNFGAASGLAGVSGIGSLTAGQNYQNQQTNPNDVAAYMSPYIQNVMNQQISAANRQYDISGTQEQSAATQAGAFGGSREALMASENERNRNTAISGIQATGLQNAFTNAQQQQYQGAQIGLQGMDQAGQAAGTLGNLGTQDLAAQTSVLGTQAAAGATQQAQQQQAINQSVLNYQNAQQQPFTDIGLMSDLIRGTPIDNTTSTTYQAQPSAISQIGGLAATGIGAYGALKANGGVIEDKGYANGGIVGYATGGSVEGSMRSKLEDLDNPHLQAIINENESPEMTKLAKEVLATNYAKGGIVAFSGENGSSVDDEDTRSPAAIAAANNAIVSASPIVNKGIAAVQDNTAAITPTQETAPVAAAPVDPMAGLQASRDTAAADAAMPMEERIQQQKDLEEKFAGKDTETAAYRKSIMDERANAPDEAKRQMYMRLMEFGANWASTPGAPLVAGMKAITSTLPGVIEDTKDNKKMMKDLDKSEYLLNHATRLESLGQLKDATAAKDKANELFMKHEDALTTYGLKKQQLDQQKEISEAELANRITTTGMTNAASIKGHEISAAAGGKDRGAITSNARVTTLTGLADDYVKSAENAETPEDAVKYNALAAQYRQQAAKIAGADPEVAEENPLDLVAQAKAEQEKRKQAALLGAK